MNQSTPASAGEYIPVSALQRARVQVSTSVQSSQAAKDRRQAQRRERRRAGVVNSLVASPDWLVGVKMSVAKVVAQECRLVAVAHESGNYYARKRELGPDDRRPFEAPSETPL